MLDKSNHKPNNIWVVKGSKFNSRLLKSWIEKNAVDIYSTDIYHSAIKITPVDVRSSIYIDVNKDK